MFFFKRKKLLEIEEKVVALTEIMDVAKRKTEETQKLLLDMNRERREEYQAIIDMLMEFEKRLNEESTANREVIIRVIDSLETRVTELGKDVADIAKNEEKQQEILDKKIVDDAAFQQSLQEKHGQIFDSAKENSCMLNQLDGEIRVLMLNSVMDVLP